MSKIRKPNALTPLPSTYVRSVLSHIGSPCGALGKPYQTTPFWSHALVDWVMGQLGLDAFFIKYSHGTSPRLCVPHAVRHRRDIDS